MQSPNAVTDQSDVVENGAVRNGAVRGTFLRVSVLVRPLIGEFVFFFIAQETFERLARLSDMLPSHERALLVCEQFH